MKRDELLSKQNGERSLVTDLRLSFSRVSGFDQDGPITLMHRRKVDNKGAEMGGIIDKLAFEPNAFKDTYYIFKASVPTGMAKTLADIILANYTEIPPRKKVYEIAKNANLWSSIVKEDVFYGKFDTKDFWDYLKASIESSNKQLISQEDLDQAEMVVEVLKTHKYSKGIMSFPQEHENKYAQVELEFRYKQFNFLGIVDLVVVNHTNKTIQFIDLKTGGKPASQFMNSFIKYRYYLQAALYQEGSKVFIEKYGLQDYKLLPFQILYISRFERLPLVFEVSQMWIDGAIKGFTTNGNYKHRGLDELVDLIDWHWTNKVFDLSKDIYEKDGLITLNSDFIKVNE